MLECAACGRRLVGDKDRYRHLEACEAFMAARPAGGQVRGRHRRIPGQSYGRDEYEAIVPFVLERVRLGAHDIDEAADAYTRGAGAEPNQLRLARIEEERERALATYRRDRDPLALEQTMNDLDAAEAEALGDRERPGLPPDEVRRYLEHLPAWWADAEPDDRRALATTLFERIRVLGISQVTLEPTQEARDHGLAEAFGPDDVEMVGARGDKPPLGTLMSRPPCRWKSRLPEWIVGYGVRPPEAHQPNDRAGAPVSASTTRGRRQLDPTTTALNPDPPMDGA